MVYTRKVKRKRFNTKKKGLKKIGIKQRNTKRNLGKRKQKGGGEITFRLVESAGKVFNELFGGLEKINRKPTRSEALAYEIFGVNTTWAANKDADANHLNAINATIDKVYENSEIYSLQGSVYLKEGQKCGTNLITELNTYMEKSEDTPHKNILQDYHKDILQNSQNKDMKCENAKGFYYGTLFLNNLLIIHLYSYLLAKDYDINDINKKIDSRFDDLTSIIKKITREDEYTVQKKWWSKREEIALEIINNGIMKIGNLSVVVNAVFTDMSYPEELCSSSADKPDLNSEAIKTMISTLKDIVKDKIKIVTRKKDSIGTASTSSETDLSDTEPSPTISKQREGQRLMDVFDERKKRREENLKNAMEKRGEKLGYLNVKSHELSEGASVFNKLAKQLNKKVKN